MPVASITLEESVERYIGKPFNLDIDPWDGSLYISDFFTNRVYRFDRSGSLVRSYGRSGAGPGEFKSVGLTFVLDDSTVVAADSRSQLLNLFNRTTGAFRRSLRYRGVLGMMEPEIHGDTVWFPSRNLALKTAVLAWDRSKDEQWHIGRLPRSYIKSIQGIGRFAAFYPYGVLAVRADTLFYTMGGSNTLFVMLANGTMLDSIAIPVARRRGVPANIVDLFAKRSRSGKKVIGLASFLVLAEWLPNGALALVHQDLYRRGEFPTGVIAGDVYVSVLSRDRTRACVDATLPVSDDARPIQSIRGDTIFLLDRSISGDHIQTTIELYRIDTSGCDWIPVDTG